MTGENWLTGWGYRKSHLITGSVGATTSYQVGIKVYKTTGTDGTESVYGTTMGKVYVGSNCRNDFGDIRFTGDLGNEELDYWIEEVSSGTYAIFWIEVADNLDSNQTIYIYYGKSDATTTSNGANTFRLFDHFNDGSLNTSLWDEGGTGTATESGTELAIASGASATDHKYVTSDVVYAIGVAVEASSKVSSLTVGTVWLGMTTTVGSLGNAVYTMAFYYHKDFGKFNWNSGNGTSVNYTNFTPADDTNYHRTSCKRTGTDDILVLDAEVNSGTEYPTATDRKISMNAYNNNGAVTITIDWIAVRKYIATEPAHSTWGDEEYEAPPTSKPSSGSIVALMRGMELI